MTRAIKSAERTLAVLELFSREQRPLSVTQVQLALDIPQPSASMLLHFLAQLGYLKFDASERSFTPSIRVALLGSWIDRNFANAGSMADNLVKLHDAVGETALIGIQNGSAVQYIIRQVGHEPRSLIIESGMYRPLVHSAIGRILLSLMTDRQIQSWVRRSNAEAQDEAAKVNLSDYMKLIFEVRRTGFAMTQGEVTPGLGAIAMAFQSPIDSTPLAVAVGAPFDRLEAKFDSVLKELEVFTTIYGRLRYH